MSAWRAALRIARRHALRARARSALVVAMVALPVVGLTAIDVLARSAQLDPAERLARDLGAAQARLSPTDGRPLVQAPDPGDGWGPAHDGRAAAQRAPAPAELVPEGFRGLPERSRGVLARTRTGVGTVRWTEVAVGDPAFRGRFRIVAGLPPRTRDEVAVSPRLLERLGVSVGAQVRLERPARTLRVSGVVEQSLAREEQTFWAVPGTLPVSGGSAAWDELYLAGRGPVTWPMVQRLNARGITVLSRDVVIHPPPGSAVPQRVRSYPGGGAVALADVLGITVILVLAALEVVLLAGAAFAVGARRQTRALALVVAAGGSPRDVRRIVLAGGLVLGAAGAAAGVAGGVALAAAARPLLEGASQQVFGHFDVHPAEVAAIALFGVLTGLLAAVLPARTAARQDPVAALAGRRANAPTPRRVPAIGVVLAAGGAVLAGLGSALALGLATGAGGSSTRAAALIGGGAALTQIGLIVCSPAIISIAGRWARVLPLAPRLALRDAARHRGRSAPAVAAVLTAVTASTALALYVAALDDHDRRGYVPRWPAHAGGLPLVSYEDRGGGRMQAMQTDPGTALRALRGRLPDATATIVGSAGTGCTNYLCGGMTVEPPRGARLAAIPAGGSFEGTPVIDAADLAAVAGASTRAARAALDRGGVVVFDPAYVRSDGTVTVRSFTAAAMRRAARSGGEVRGRRQRLPAAVLRLSPAPAEALFGRSAARRLGVRTQPGTLLLSFSGRMPSGAEEDAARAALRDAGIDAELTVEHGYVSHYGLGLLALAVGAALIVLGAAGIATGLAQADARPDHATLAAIGAEPRLRRTLAAAQSLAITGLGTALGVVAGFVPALALIGAAPSLELTLPWAQLGAVLVVVPLLAGALAWLATRSRLPLDRRVT